MTASAKYFKFKVLTAGSDQDHATDESQKIHISMIPFNSTLRAALKEKNDSKKLDGLLVQLNVGNKGIVLEIDDDKILERAIYDNCDQLPKYKEAINYGLNLIDPVKNQQSLYSNLYALRIDKPLFEKIFEKDKSKD